METNPAPRLIGLRDGIDGPMKRSLFRLIEKPVESVLSLSALNRVYAESLAAPDDGNYFRRVLEVMNTRYEVSDEDRAKIPAAGPVMVVANHPFGGADGLVLGDLLTQARPDLRILGNQLLASVPQLRQQVIAVDPFGGARATWTNVAPMKACLRWLKQGGMLGVFPSGTVSYLQVRDACVSDPPWQANVAALARRTGATVLPVFFEGRNSALFQLAGLVHPSLRTALLPSELIKRSHSSITVRVGRPIGPDKLGRYEDDQTLIDYLRWKTYMLRHRESPIRPRFRQPPPPAVDEPVAEPLPGGALAGEIAQLPAGAELCAQGAYQVFIAQADQIPLVLQEIGRLREVTFREVSEGTGKSRDLDRFDASYLHLFMWNRTAGELVGSYRLGRVDDLLAAEGVRGLYTSTLFKFNAGFLEKLGPALELGRSFVRQEYQRKPLSLALIWRGIGEYLVRNPQYKILFGPVSISKEYRGLSRQLMVELLESHRGDGSLGPMVKAKNPPRERLDRQELAVLKSLVKDVEDISTLVSEIEDDGRGMPVLLKHYLRLNARLLSFNVDESFGSCIDGLIVVDLRTTIPKILKRFMGEEGFARFAAA